MSSDDDDKITAYLSHLKRSTKQVINGNEASTSSSGVIPAKETNVANNTSGIIHSKSSVDNILNKYGGKYIKSAKKLANDVKVQPARRNSVTFDDEPLIIKEAIEYDSEFEDSMMDAELSRYLKEMSLSEGKSISVSQDVGPKRSKSSNISTVDSLMVTDSDNISEKINIVDVSDGLVVEKIDNSPERSRKNVFASTSQRALAYSSKMEEEEDESNSLSSTSKKYLSEKISRRNSYVYKENMELVQAASADDTIKTDSELEHVLSDENSQPLETSTPRQKLKEKAESAKPTTGLIQKTFNSLQDVKKRAKTMDKERINQKKKDPYKKKNSTGEGKLQLVEEKSKSVSKSEKKKNKKQLGKVKNFSRDSDASLHLTDSDYDSSSSKSTKKTRRKSQTKRISSLKTNKSKGKKKNRKDDNRKYSKHESFSSSSYSSSSEESSVLQSDSSSEESSSSTTTIVSSEEKHKKHKSRKKISRKKIRTDRKGKSSQAGCSNCEIFQKLFWSSPHLMPPPSLSIGGAPSYPRRGLDLFNRSQGTPFTFNDPYAQDFRTGAGNLSRIDDYLRQTVLLGQQFLLSQRSMYDAYCASLSSNHRYTTLNKIEQHISSHKKSYTKTNKDFFDVRK